MTSYFIGSIKSFNSSTVNFILVDYYCDNQLYKYKPLQEKLANDIVYIVYNAKLKTYKSFESSLYVYKHKYYL